MNTYLKWSCVYLPLAASGWVAHAEVFPDNEARRAILDLRVDVKRLADDSKRNFDKIQSDKQASDLELKKANELIAKLQQALRDSQLEDLRLQQEIDKANRLQNQSLLQLKTDLDLLKQQIAELRGEKEQLAKDISVIQRNQKDLNSGIEDKFSKVDQRFTKVEPVSVQLDGIEFQTNLTEKKDFELALATFNRGEYGGALNAFTVFLRKYPYSGFRQSALFWASSAKFVKGEYTDAASQLKAFLAMNEGHARYPDALLALANVQIELKQLPEAKKTLEDLIKDYPNLDVAKSAADRLSKLKLP
jgi:tol-pal system protein YbgF